MKKLSFFLMAMLFSVMSFAAETVAYTLTTATTGKGGDNSAYAKAVDYTSDDITWNVTGNSEMVPWRIGGKSITAVDRAVYTKTAMAADITKIEITHATVNLTCNSCTLTISDAANGDGETFPVKVAQNTTTTITLPEGDYSNKFYKLVYNVTNTSTSNKYVQLSEIKFYTEVQTSVEAPTFTPEEGKVDANKTNILENAKNYVASEKYYNRNWYNGYVWVGATATEAMPQVEIPAAPAETPAE